MVVVAFVAVAFVTKRLSPVAFVTKRFVVEAMVANKVVVVALVLVPLTNVMFWKVEELYVMTFVNSARPGENNSLTVILVEKKLVEVA